MERNVSVDYRARSSREAATERSDPASFHRSFARKQLISADRMAKLWPSKKCHRQERNMPIVCFRRVCGGRKRWSP